MFRRLQAIAARDLHAVLGRISWRRHIAPILFGCAVLALMIQLDAFEKFTAFSHEHEDWQLDEFLTSFAVFGAVAMWFVRVRSKELEREATRRAEAEQCLETALHTMHHGISMFDADQRLVICNSRYGEVYDLPPSLTRPGTPLKEILEFRRENAAPGEPSPEDYYRVLLANLKKGGTHTTIREFNDGRSVCIVYEPREDGGWVSTHEDITERRRIEQRLSYLAHHDALTELANRVLLRERLELALDDLRPGEELAMLCLDLDHFKHVNDTLGHPVGDELLKRVAERLRDCVRKSDLVARMGGDEFAILQIGATQPMAATTLAARLVEVIAQPYDINGHSVLTGTSIGIAIAPADGDNPDQIIKSADLALYLAKGEGRGVYRFFEKEMDQQMHARRQLELDLRRALAEQQFELYYQPILDLSTNEVRGLEALIRWNHPERGRISPADFVPLAEETGLIVPIGEWVLREACREAARWPDNVLIAVNVSPVQFKSSALVRSVFNAVAAAAISPNRLELEITETIFLQDSETTLGTLHQLRALGVRIVMDDFGTGYSSLSYFQRFPFDKVKIDRSFVQDLGDGTCALAILRAIASLADNLHITTTAEGVETEEQLARIRDEGISQVQGYLVSPPRPVGELGPLMTSAGAGRMAG